jgi:hypothetical protein
MKVLLYCPLSPGKPNIHPQTLESILSLKCHYEIDVMFGREDMSYPSINGKYENIAKKYRHAREVVLKNNYHFLMTVESDIIFPDDALYKLLDVGTDVAYGLVMSKVNKHWYMYLEGPTRGKQVSRDPIKRREVWGKIVPSVGIGNGCTLIRRHVLEELTYYARPKVAQDWNFAHDCQSKGFTQAHHCGVICGHIGDKIYWPDPKRIYIAR